MTAVRKSAVVPFSAAEMYALVNDVESYPVFLPWCEAARVHESTDTSLVASITLAVGRIRQEFSTGNTMQPGRRIDVRLLSGPFKYLHGNWQFTDAGTRRCRISLEMEFEFKSRLLKLALEKLFNHILNSLVDAFVERARELYGNGRE